MAYDPRVIRAISREAIRRYGRRGFSRSEKRKIKSAFQTGIVESGLRNLSYGDADSQGWRQERSSLYPNPTNVRASVRRYFSEADQLYRPGETAASLSGRVQRPASQYLYRYGQQSAEGKRLLKANVLRPSRGRGGVPGAEPARGAGKASGAVGGTLRGVPAPRVSAPYAGLPDPAHTARRFLRLPEASGELPSSGAPPAPDAPMSALLKSAVGSTPRLPSTPTLRIGAGPTATRFAGVPGAAPVGRSGLIGSWRRNGVTYRFDPRLGRWVRPGSGRTPVQEERRQRGEQAARQTGPMVGRRAYPAARRGSLIGTPYAGTHSLGNWQSDNAVDIGLKMGTPIRAVTDGQVVKTGGSSSMAGRFGGYNLTVTGPANSFFYAHLQKLSVRPGQRVRKGQIVGYSGSANGVPHLHLGVLRGNPLNLFGWR